MKKTTDKNLNYATAISKLAPAIEYLTWAIDSNSSKEKLHWAKASLKMIEYAKDWIEKELPF